MNNETQADSKGKKKFPASIGFWPAKNGNGYTVFINSKVIAALETAQEGGMLFLQEVTNSKVENAPTYQLVVFKPKDEQAGI